MKKYLFILLLSFFFACTPDTDFLDTETEFQEVRGMITATDRLTFVEEDNNARFQIVFENEAIDTSLIRFKLGSMQFAFFEAIGYEFEESRVGEMWFNGGGDCEEFRFVATKTFEDFGGIEKLKFEPEPLFWDCLIYVAPEDSMPMEFRVFVRKKS